MDNSQSYSEDYYNLHINRLRKNDLFHRHRMNILRDLVRPVKGERILDLGCGMGTISIEFAKLGAEMVGLDDSEVAINLANRTYQDIGTGRAQFVRGDVRKLPFDIDNFDKIVCADLVEHIERTLYLTMLLECHRVLRKKGKLIIYTPCPTHIFEFLKKRNWILKEDESHIDLKNMEYLKHTLIEASYTIERECFTNSFIPVWKNVERVLMYLPILGQFFRRRICIVAAKALIAHRQEVPSGVLT